VFAVQFKRSLVVVKVTDLPFVEGMTSPAIRYPGLHKLLVVDVVMTKSALLL
jgi:hypothetical protein